MNPRFLVRIVRPENPDIELVETLRKAFTTSDTIFIFGSDFIFDVLEIDTGRRWRIHPDGIWETEEVQLIGGPPRPPRDR